MLLLEVGHGITPIGHLDPGTVWDNPNNEYELNGIAASAARRVIRRADLFHDFTDAVKLRSQGERAVGYGVFCLVHQNSAS